MKKSCIKILAMLALLTFNSSELLYATPKSVVERSVHEMTLVEKCKAKLSSAVQSIKRLVWGNSGWKENYIRRSFTAMAALIPCYLYMNSGASVGDASNGSGLLRGAARFELGGEGEIKMQGERPMGGGREQKELKEDDEEKRFAAAERWVGIFSANVYNCASHCRSLLDNMNGGRQDKDIGNYAYQESHQVREKSLNDALQHYNPAIIGLQEYTHWGIDPNDGVSRRRNRSPQVRSDISGYYHVYEEDFSRSLNTNTRGLYLAVRQDVFSVLWQRDEVGFDERYGFIAIGVQPLNEAGQPEGEPIGIINTHLNARTDMKTQLEHIHAFITANLGRCKRWIIMGDFNANADDVYGWAVSKKGYNWVPNAGKITFASPRGEFLAKYDHILYYGFNGMYPNNMPIQEIYPENLNAWLRGISIDGDDGDRTKSHFSDHASVIDTLNRDFLLGRLRDERKADMEVKENAADRIAGFGNDEFRPRPRLKEEDGDADGLDRGLLLPDGQEPRKDLAGPGRRASLGSLSPMMESGGGDDRRGRVRSVRSADGLRDAVREPLAVGPRLDEVDGGVGGLDLVVPDGQLGPGDLAEQPRGDLLESPVLAVELGGGLGSGVAIGEPLAVGPEQLRAEGSPAGQVGGGVGGLGLVVPDGRPGSGDLAGQPRGDLLGSPMSAADGGLEGDGGDRKIAAAEVAGMGGEGLPGGVGGADLVPPVQMTRITKKAWDGYDGGVKACGVFFNELVVAAQKGAIKEKLERFQKLKGTYSWENFLKIFGKDYQVTFLFCDRTRPGCVLTERTVSLGKFLRQLCYSTRFRKKFGAHDPNNKEFWKSIWDETLHTIDGNVFPFDANLDDL